MSSRFRSRQDRRRLLVTGIALALIIAGAAAIEMLRERGPSGPEIRIIGPEQIAFNWSEEACERDDFPDVPARAFRDADGRVQLLASHSVSRRMLGPSLDALTRDCAVVMDSHHNPDPAMFDDWEWIHAVYALDGRRVFALIHDEYHGHRHAGQCPSGEYLRCWYNTVTLASPRIVARLTCIPSRPTIWLPQFRTGTLRTSGESASSTPATSSTALPMATTTHSSMPPAIKIRRRAPV